MADNPLLNMPQSPDNPTVLVFEQTPKWVPELQRQFHSDDSIQVRTIPRLSEAAERLASAANPVLVLYLDAAPAGCLRLLSSLSGQSRKLPVIVLASDVMSDLEWSVRELGAVEFRSGFVPGFEIANLCRKQWSS